MMLVAAGTVSVSMTVFVAAAGVCMIVVIMVVGKELSPAGEPVGCPPSTATTE